MPRLWPRVPWRRSLLSRHGDGKDVVKTRRRHDFEISIKTLSSNLSKSRSRISHLLGNLRLNFHHFLDVLDLKAWNLTLSAKFAELCMIYYVLVHLLAIFHHLSSAFHVCPQWSLHIYSMTASGWLRSCRQSDSVLKWQGQRLYIYNHLPCTIVKHVHHVQFIFHSTAFFLTSSATGCSSYWDMPVCDDTMLRSRVPTSAFASLVTSTNGYIIVAVWLRYTSSICQLSSYKCLCNRHRRLGVHGCTQMCWFSSHPNSKQIHI